MKDESIRANVIEKVRAAFAPYVHGDEVSYTAACWLVGARNQPSRGGRDGRSPLAGARRHSTNRREAAVDQGDERGAGFLRRASALENAECFSIGRAPREHDGAGEKPRDGVGFRFAEQNASPSAVSSPISRSRALSEGLASATLHQPTVCLSTRANGCFCSDSLPTRRR